MCGNGPPTGSHLDTRPMLKRPAASRSIRAAVARTRATTPASPNPSYLALDPTLRHLYSVNEMTAGAVSAFALNQANGMLTFLNMMPTNGKDTTHLSVQPSGQYLFAASYTSGNFQVFHINSDGSIGGMTDNFQDVGNGTGPNPARQEGPHAHQILTDLDGNHVFG